MNLTQRTRLLLLEADLVAYPEGPPPYIQDPSNYRPIDLRSSSIVKVLTPKGRAALYHYSMRAQSTNVTTYNFNLSPEYQRDTWAAKFGAKLVVLDEAPDE